MTIQQRIAYRQMISEVLMYMTESSRSEGEILEVQNKMEKTIEKFISGVVAIMVPGAKKFRLSISDKVEFRKKISATLHQISLPTCTPEKVILMIDSLEAWAENRLEQTARVEMGKPKMFITRPDFLN